MSDPYIGEIRFVGFTFAPVGWAQCVGNLISIVQNQALFALLGTVYGGNGQSTFGLPDLRGRSPVGTGTGMGLATVDPGEMGGSESIQLTLSNLPAHTHTAQSSGSLSVSGSVSVPACSSPTSGTVAANPGATTVLGSISAGGRPGELYTTTAANTNLKPFTLQSTGTLPAITVGTTGGSQPVSVQSPYLGLTAIISMQGIFPTRG
ncbi:phage tail protein [Dyella nitratireducens]|uniref:Microcystin dependent MdpB family protein n=1 Tax=Dyella nitratireducens TaxID=1849580 RepID=A0ABQ1FX94_9GAMM|nr:tail fiber protein [Dyella nitratireducens]GGA31470.1 microcystin dependent MdpB family protein [Dyella nitratireducens]GLQ42866.1 microcystin dependent MdpB family protein [Dyella nitratireducens]